MRSGVFGTASVGSQPEIRRLFIYPRTQDTGETGTRNICTYARGNPTSRKKKTQLDKARPAEKVN